MKLLLLFFVAFLVGICANAQSNFHFVSGFEQSSFLQQYELNGTDNKSYADIYGTDNTTGYNWVTDLDNDPNIGNFRIYYEVGDTLKAKAIIVPDPLNVNNQVLKFKIDTPNVLINGKSKGRIQASINGNTNLKEFSFKVRLYIHPDIDILRYYDNNFNWFTLMEFWNNGPSKPFPFRITLNIQKPDDSVGSNLYFGAHGQTKDISTTGKWHTVWESLDTTYIVPTGQWLTFETYFFEGDSLNGRYEVIVTDTLNKAHTLFNINNYTHHPSDQNPNGVNNFNPMKLYTSSNLIGGMQKNHAELSVFWDDFEIWTNLNTLDVREKKFSNIQIYPNPIENILYIKDFQQIKRLSIYNLRGEIIKYYNKLSNESLNLSDLPAGLYILKIVNMDNKAIDLKVLKK